MRTANELVNEIALDVRPPRGVAIVLTENPGSLPNWVAAAGTMDPMRADKFAVKVAELRNTDPIVDWGPTSESAGEVRRVAKFLSEATD